MCCGMTPDSGASVTSLKIRRSCDAYSCLWRELLHLQFNEMRSSEGTCEASFWTGILLGHDVDGVDLMEQNLHPHATNHVACYRSAAWAELIQWDGWANPVRWEAPQRASSEISPLERCPTGHFMMLSCKNGRVPGGHPWQGTSWWVTSTLMHTCIGQLHSCLLTMVESTGFSTRNTP